MKIDVLETDSIHIQNLAFIQSYFVKCVDMIVNHNFVMSFYS